MLHALRSRVRVVTQTGAHTRQLVGGDRRADAAATHDDAALGAAVDDSVAHRGREVGVVHRFGRRRAEVDDVVAGLAQPAGQMLLQLEASVVGGNRNAHRKVTCARKHLQGVRRE